MESIIDFAWESDHLRNPLKEANTAVVLKQEQAHVWDYCFAPMQIAAHMAYTCVQEGKSSNLLRRYKEDDSNFCLIEFIRYDINLLWLCKKLSKAISQNPCESFLALRFLARYIGTFARVKSKAFLKRHRG